MKASLQPLYNTIGLEVITEQRQSTGVQKHALPSSASSRPQPSFQTKNVEALGGWFHLLHPILALSFFPWSDNLIPKKWKQNISDSKEPKSQQRELPMNKDWPMNESQNNFGYSQEHHWFLKNSPNLIFLATSQAALLRAEKWKSKLTAPGPGGGGWGRRMLPGRPWFPGLTLARELHRTPHTHPWACEHHAGL